MLIVFRYVNGKVIFNEQLPVPRRGQHRADGRFEICLVEVRVVMGDGGPMSSSANEP